MNRWRVGEDRGSKETDGCPLTGVGVDVHMHKVECELMGGSRGYEVRIWTDVPLQHPLRRPWPVTGGYAAGVP
jgi:hypothetical protein